MDEKQFTCHDCDAEFNVEYDFLATPEFCPFCGSKLDHDDRDIDEDWEDDDSDRGC